MPHLTQREAAAIKIMLVDDHEVVRVGLRSLLDRVPGFRIVAEAGTADSAVKTVEELAADKDVPDVVIMDVRMPGGSGVDACRAIRSRFPQVQVIMLTSYSDNEAIFASVLAGAAGYVLKQVGSAELIRAIRTVHSGGSLLDPETTKTVLEHVRAGQVPGPDTNPSVAKAILMDMPEPLSEQEQRILSLISQGRTNREIAEEIFLSEKTVRNYVSNILGKLNLSNRAEAAAFAVRHGIASRPRV